MFEKSNTTIVTWCTPTRAFSQRWIARSLIKANLWKTKVNNWKSSSFIELFTELSLSVTFVVFRNILPILFFGLHWNKTFSVTYPFSLHNVLQNVTLESKIKENFVWEMKNILRNFYKLDHINFCLLWQ